MTIEDIIRKIVHEEVARAIQHSAPFPPTAQPRPGPEDLPRGALLAPAAAASHIGVEVSTLKAWRYRGEGPAFLKVGRLVRYTAGDLRDWIQAQSAAISRPG